MVVTLSMLLAQGLASGLSVEWIGWLLARRAVGTHVWSNALATLMLIVFLLAGHLTQIAAWALVFIAIGEFAAFADAFYHSAVNYTTLGYGDLIMSPRSRLLGPLEAVGGMLAFGLSTAIIVTIVLRLFRLRHRRLRTAPRGNQPGALTVAPVHDLLLDHGLAVLFAWAFVVQAGVPAPAGRQPQNSSMGNTSMTPEFLAQSGLRVSVFVQWVWTYLTGQHCSRLIVSKGRKSDP